TFLSAAIFKTDVHKKALNKIQQEQAKVELNNNGHLPGTDHFDQVLVENGQNLNRQESENESNLIEMAQRDSISARQPSNGTSASPRPNQWVSTLILDMSQILHIDVSGIEILTELKDQLDKMKTQLL